METSVSDNRDNDKKLNDGSWLSVSRVDETAALRMKVFSFGDSPSQKQLSSFCKTLLLSLQTSEGSAG